MDHLALYVNDAAHAAPMIAALRPGLAGPRCTVVLCPPRLSHHIGRFLSERQRRQWRATWSERVRRELSALLPDGLAAPLHWTTADHPLPRTAVRLRREQGPGLRLLDLRRAAPGAAPAALEAVPGAKQPFDWSTPAVLAGGVAAALALVD